MKEKFGILFPKSIEPTSIIREADKSLIETKPEPAKADVRINRDDGNQWLCAICSGFK